MTIKQKLIFIFLIVPLAMILLIKEAVVIGWDKLWRGVND